MNQRTIDKVYCLAEVEAVRQYLKVESDRLEESSEPCFGLGISSGGSFYVDFFIDTVRSTINKLIKIKMAFLQRLSNFVETVSNVVDSLPDSAFFHQKYLKSARPN